MSYTFECPFCGVQYSDTEGLYYSEMLAKKGKPSLLVILQTLFNWIFLSYFWTQTVIT